MKAKHFLNATLMASIILLSQACTWEDPKPQHTSTIIHLVDQTCDVDYLAVEEAIRDHLQNELELQDGTTAKSADVILALIDGKRFGRVQKLSLPPPQEGQSYKGRKKDVQVFLDSIPGFIGTISGLPVDTSQTYLYQPFIDLMLELNDRLDHTNTDITIWSDALENGKQFSFYRYRDSPEDILSETDTIIEEIESLYGTCPHLKGTTVTFYTIPNKDDDALCYGARKTLELFITKYGGDFKIKVSESKLKTAAGQVITTTM